MSNNYCQDHKEFMKETNKKFDEILVKLATHSEIVKALTEKISDICERHELSARNNWDTMKMVAQHEKTINYILDWKDSWKIPVFTATLTVIGSVVAFVAVANTYKAKVDNIERLLNEKIHLSELHNSYDQRVKAN